MLLKLSNFIKYISIFFFIIFYYLSANAISLKNVKESVQYGKETSLEKACILVEEELFDKARRLASGGETLSADSTKICKKSNTESRCNLYTNSFRSIAAIKIVKYDRLKFSDGTECRFSALGNNIFEASRKGNFTLQKLPKPDINFDFRVELNKYDFISYPVNSNKEKRKLNEVLLIDIETYKDMYISVFQWLPYVDSNSIEKVFPNKFDTNNFFKSNIKHSIPTTEKLQKYSLRVHFPDENVVFSEDAQVFLMMIGTKEKIDFFDSYTYTGFGEKLVIIENFREHRKSYIIRKRLD